MTDVVERANFYIANNAAESGADVLIAELAAEIERLRAASQWQPIATAPVGFPVLLWCPEDKPQVVTGVLCDDGDGKFWRFEDYRRNVSYGNYILDSLARFR